jgi:outer membrane protein OmpA-like peptidoglycan-associated protein
MAGGTHIEVSGHTDSQGAPQRNKALSERRAKAVVDYLVKKNGIDPAKITGVGYGEERPIASNDTPEGMAQNRRIEMTVK